MTLNGTFGSTLRDVSRRASDRAPFSYYYGYFTAWAEPV